MKKRVEDFCFVPEGEGISDKVNNFFVINSDFPFLKVLVREPKDRYAIKFKPTVAEFYPKADKENYKWLKNLFPLYADLWTYKGYNGYVIELSYMPEEGMGVQWSDFAFISGGRFLEGQNVFVVGLNQSAFPTERYLVAFFMEGGRLLVEKADLDYDGAVLYQEYLYEVLPMGVFGEKLRENRYEPLR